MLLEAVGRPLRLADVPVREPEPARMLVRVRACGICRTDLHIVDGELTEPKLPLIPGHQIVGEVAALGSGVEGWSVGDRVGVPWLGWTCGECEYCAGGRENLCDAAQFTGYQLDGGFAEYAIADARFCFPITAGFGDLQAAPLLCAGLIGYRAYRMAGPGRLLGLYGFGSSAHLVIQLALHEGREVYTFTRAGDSAAATFASSLGATWTGGSDETPPRPLDAAIIFAPVGDLVPRALASVRKGGVVVCAGIHMTDIPSFPYSLLWGERQVRSVANLTRRDGEEFLELAASIPIRTAVRILRLEEANEALTALRSGVVEGAVVLEVG